MEKKRAKEIALLEWGTVRQLLELPGYTLPADRDIDRLKEHILDLLLQEHRITEEERALLRCNAECALCAFCEACWVCPLAPEGGTCLSKGQPYWILRHAKADRFTIDDCREAVKEIISMIEAWEV